MASERKSSFSDLWPTYKRFIRFVKPDTRLLALDYLTIVIAVATNTAMIWLIGKPFNLLQNEQYDQVFSILILFAVVVLVNQSAQFFGGLLTNAVGLRSIGRLRNAILDRILFLSFPVAGQIQKGDLLARLTNDIDRVKVGIVETPIYAVSHILTFFVYIGMLFWINITLALIAVVISFVFVVQQKLFSSPKRHAAENYFMRNGQLLAFEEQAISHMRGVSTNVAESLISELHRSSFEKARYWAMRELGLNIGFNISFTFLLYLTCLIVVLVGIDGIQDGRFGVGHLVSFILYLGYINVPARGMADLLFQSMGNLGAANRILDVFDAQPLVKDSANAKQLEIKHGGLELKELHFRYPDGPQIYNDVSLVVEPGETIALVGPSGVGKSTLANLLMRFYDPDQGKILIDGIDVQTCTVESLRKNISVVWQEPFIINDTIKANLLMVDPVATEEQLITACKHSYAWDFICDLENGLQTKIGADGTTLSAGQVQRLAIAQAFLRDAAILILDEATSALDSLSELNVINALDHLRKNKTTFIIAHRFSAIKSADRVVYFNGDGTITVGAHSELMQKHAGYRKAVEWQTKEVE
ncbi:MAG: ABC transporter ATP-binding protein [Gammaproteobacteria bacterium]|nr:ABC transporter ATP-binding protein [Gammaproteobacteria bacterium]